LAFATGFFAPGDAGLAIRSASSTMIRTRRLTAHRQPTLRTAHARHPGCARNIASGIERQRFLQLNIDHLPNRVFGDALDRNEIVGGSQAV